MTDESRDSLNLQASEGRSVVTSAWIITGLGAESRRPLVSGELAPLSHARETARDYWTDHKHVRIFRVDISEDATTFTEEPLEEEKRYLAASYTGDVMIFRMPTYTQRTLRRDWERITPGTVWQSNDKGGWDLLTNSEVQNLLKGPNP